MTDSDEVTEASSTAEVDRRAALKKVAGFGAAAGAVWAAPAVNGLSVVPAFAAAQSAPTSTTEAPTTTVTPRPQIVANGTATKTLGCFSGAIGDDTYLIDLGDDGWWHFYFQGCSALSTESVALHDPAGPPLADAYRPPTGYQCKMQLLNGTSVVYDTGYVSDPINGIADTGGYVFIGTAAYPNGYGNMNWRIICDPL